MIGGGYGLEDGSTFYPITAPVLIIVGCLMAPNLTQIDWKQWDEALPSYLIVVGMPLTYSIADGMALGLDQVELGDPLLQGAAGERHGERAGADHAVAVAQAAVVAVGRGR